MTGWLLLILTASPALAALACLVVRCARGCEALNLAAAVISLLAALPLPALAMRAPAIYWSSYVGLDAAGAWTILCTALVYFLASLYAVGYMRMLGEDERLPRFYTLFAAFAFTMLAAPLMNNIGVYWIAVELTTLVSTFLVGFELGRESIEAAWKYIIVVSAGISLALLGTVLLYWGGSLVVGPTYDMTWEMMRSLAPRIDPTLLTTAFLLFLIGYGTKVGLAPMHTWLPDAHSEGPSPVSAMLSGALLNTAMLGILRFLAIVDAGHGGLLPRTVLVALGAFSLLVAALFIVRQEGIKRLMAYSSVEHMGVLALAFGFGGPLGIAGGLYHMLNHSLNKSLMFFGAGNVMRGYGTKHIPAIRRVLSVFPRSGLLWLAGAVAITGAPPFGLFLSELTVLRAGLGGPNAWAAVLMLILLIVIFVGFLNHFRLMYFDERGPVPGEVHPISAWCVVPMVLALIPLLLLGLWWPQAFWHFFGIVQRQLQGVGP